MKRYHIVSHTHWDREWYEPFEVFRVRLVRLIDHLLELVETAPGYRFNLDAQTIVMEDYLEVRPENRSRLERAVSEGNILIGPWYVQNDFYQTCGESTIRNLLLGTAKAKEWGATRKMTGYAPDHFGIISQLPQILRGFGMDSLIFGRGRVCNPENGKKGEFIFEGIDGSQVLAVQLVGFYNNAQRFSEDPARARRFFEMIREKLEPCTVSGEYLLMNGCDHLEAQENLMPILKGLQSGMKPDETIFQSTLSEYADAVRSRLKNPEIHRGELRQSGERLLSIGTLSTRIGLKTSNTRLENLLFIRLQGLCAMLAWAGLGKESYDAGMLKHLWHILIQNHPHDSICGCSADSVIRHIEDRFMRVREASEMLLKENLRRLTVHAGGGRPQDYSILLVNSLPFRRGLVAETELDLLEDEKIEDFRLLDSEGNEVPYSAGEAELTERPLRSPVNLPGRKRVDRRQIRFYAEVPAMGYRLFTVRAGEKTVPGKPLDFRNEFLALEIHPDGKIDLKDRRDGRVFPDLLGLEDTGDFGDAYTYRPYPGNEVVSTAGFLPEIEVECNDAVQSVCVLKYRLPIPEKIEREKKQRSGNTVENLVEIRLKIQAGIPYLDVTVSGDNRSRDHFLRAVIRTGIDSEVTQSSGIFEVAERDRRSPDCVPRNDCEEPVRDFVRIQNPEQGSMTILTDGLHSFEHYRERRGEIGIGLLRCNEYLMAYYELPLDKTWHVPENQCPGPFSGHFAILPGTSDPDCGNECRLAQSFNHPFLSWADSFDSRKFSGGRACVQDSEVSEIFERPDPQSSVKLPPEASFCSVSGNHLLLSTVKQSEDGTGWILRFWNESREKTEAVVTFGMEVFSAGLWNMAEDRMLEELQLTDFRHLTLHAQGAEIVTLKIITDRNS